MCPENQVTWSTLLKGLFEEHVKKEIQVSQDISNFEPVSTLRAHDSINLSSQVCFKSFNIELVILPLLTALLSHVKNEKTS